MAGLSLEKIEAIAPDQASLSAARKLLKPTTWSGLTQGGAGLVWGECQGSGAMPYRVVIAETDAGYKCTCPSRKFPCKHSLALMWMRAEGKTSFEAGSPPEWVLDWLRRRRSSGEPTQQGDDENGRSSASKSIALTATEPATTKPDEKAEARAAAARERNRKEREEAIAKGLDDLDQWLADQIDAGLAGFAANAGKSCRLIAQRLVDAKAPGLAARLESLPARLYSLPESARPNAAVEELGQLHLIAQAYRRQDALEPALREDVRREVGWTQTRESLLADPDALRVAGKWRVVGTLSEIQPDRLTRIETWLWHEGSDQAPRFAVLIDFMPMAAGAVRGPYLAGECLEASLVFYASPVPLRALAGNVTAARGSSEKLDLTADGLGTALKEYDRALAAKPWLDAWPMAFRNARMRKSGQQLFLCANEDAAVALPLLPSQAAFAVPLLALDSIDGAALWDGTHVRLLLAQTEFGRWLSE